MGHIAIDAIVHMIGQTEDIFKRGASVAEVATWLECSKPTAKRWMNDNLVTGNSGVIHDVVKYRPHVWASRYYLSPEKRSAYERGVYYKSYLKYAQEVWS